MVPRPVARGHLTATSRSVLSSHWLVGHQSRKTPRIWATSKSAPREIGTLSRVSLTIRKSARAGPVATSVSFLCESNELRYFGKNMCRSMSICTLMFVICSWLFSIPESTTDLSSPRVAQICRQNRHPTTTECRDTFCHQDTFFAYLPSDFWRRCHAHHEINFSSVRADLR